MFLYLNGYYFCINLLQSQILTNIYTHYSTLARVFVYWNRLAPWIVCLLTSLPGTFLQLPLFTTALSLREQPICMHYHELLVLKIDSLVRLATQMLFLQRRELIIFIGCCIERRPPKPAIGPLGDEGIRRGQLNSKLVKVVKRLSQGDGGKLRLDAV